MQKKIVNLIVSGESPHKLKRRITEIASIPHEPLRAVLSIAERFNISQNVSSSVIIETAFAEIVVNTDGFAEKTRGHCGLLFRHCRAGGCRAAEAAVIVSFRFSGCFSDSPHHHLL
jgi:hypothetical protein